MFIIFRAIHETVMLVFSEFRNNKLRTFLSLLGVSIGIFCIITVLSAVDSLKRNIDSGVAKLGSDNLYIQRWPWIFGGEDYAWWEYIKRPTMKYDEYKLLNEKLTSAKAVAIETGFNSREVKYNDNVIKDGRVSAVSEHYDKIYAMEFEHGRFFTQLESASGSPVVLLGYTVYKTLFPDLSDPTGSMIWVLGNKLKVVGAIAKEGESIIDFSQDNNILITYNYVRRIMDMQDVDPVIEVKPKEGISAREIKDDIIPLLRNHRKLSPREENDFAINEVTLAADAFDSIFGVVNMVGFIIGFFSCLVGGFGIANIMFVSVKERTHIIGIKKSIGAKNYLILLEFLFEAVVLSFIGCAFGLLMVWIITMIANRVIDFEFILSINNVMFGVMLATFIGVIAGIVPAITASRMDPVEAIRSKG
ncbi:MAG: ABC transporter permease [Bacteroidetes bacterium]|nr:ABC transporter permease [Bacteroidota bacterium]MBP7400070.1 ABC transporter permease [Chitinophagales bacterium]MBK7110812.1 ABC transporter permease [Bacteroidota bacterium]MBK8487967.1 ABC transporter permease [Bacteroidota bacterium]MBK8682275.1 ABC transporter permease [Bacteroidota bacterium]